MSVPLLLVRTKEGRGPLVPILTKYRALVVEGLGEDGSVIVHGMDLAPLKNGRYELTVSTGKLQAELCGQNNCASVWLE